MLDTATKRQRASSGDEPQGPRCQQNKDNRKLRRLTQEQLAQRVDRTVFAISQLERGKSLPSFETLERLSVALEVPVKEFFDDGTEAAGMSPHRLSLTTAIADRVRSMADDQIEATLRMVEAMWPKARK